MFFLLLAVASSAAMALIFKYSESRDGNRYALTSANYLTAFIVSLGMCWISQNSWTDVSYQELWADLGQVFFRGETLEPQTSLAWSLGLGLPSGFFLFLGLVFYQAAVREAGVSLAGSFAKLGILLPMILSLVFWKELPGFLQWIGIILALAAILAVSWPGPGQRRAFQLPLILLFLSVGLADFSNKLFQKLAIMEHKSFFLAASFGSALLLSLVPNFIGRIQVARRDLWLGFCVGVPNLLSSYFLIMALDRYPAVLVFPVFSAGTIVAIFGVSHVFFGERLSRRAYVAMSLILPALVLINL